MPHLGVVPGSSSVSASAGTLATTESSCPPTLPCTGAKNAASPIPDRAPAPARAVAPRAFSADVYEQFSKMAGNVTAMQWAAAEPDPGGNRSNIMVGHAALRLDGGEGLVEAKGTFVSRKSLSGTEGFASSPIGLKVVHIGVTPRVPKPRLLGQAKDRYNPADFIVLPDDLNNVKIPDRHWMGKAMPAGEGAAVKLDGTTYVLETRVRACTEVQFLEGVSRNLGTAFHNGDVPGTSVAGEIYLLTRFRPCQTNCADLIREVREALPNVQVHVATFDANGNIRAWAGPAAPIRVPQLYVPPPVAAPPSVNAWHQRLQASQSPSPTVEASSTPHATRFAFNLDAKTSTPGASSINSDSSSTR